MHGIDGAVNAGRPPVDQDRPRVEVARPEDAEKERLLAMPLQGGDAHDLARGHGQRHVLEVGRAPHVAHLEHGRLSPALHLSFRRKGRGQRATDHQANDLGIRDSGRGERPLDAAVA